MIRVYIVRDMIQGKDAPHEVVLSGQDGTWWYVAEYKHRATAVAHARQIRKALKPLNGGIAR